MFGKATTKIKVAHVYVSRCSNIQMHEALHNLHGDCTLRTMHDLIARAGKIYLTERQRVSLGLSCARICQPVDKQLWVTAR